MDLTFNILSLSTVGVALAAALTGSIHCVGMCGPLRLIVDNSLKSSFFYQIGRGSIYLILGAFVGKLGSYLQPIYLLFFLLLSILIHFFRKNKKPILYELRTKLLRKGKGNPYLMGFFSGLLPCGFLHGWIIIAATTSSLKMGFVTMLILWLGTLPALEASARALRSPLQKMVRNFPKLATALFLIMVLVPVGLRASTYFQKQKNGSSQEMSCHHH